MELLEEGQLTEISQGLIEMSHDEMLINQGGESIFYWISYGVSSFFHGPSKEDYANGLQGAMML